MKPAMAFQLVQKIRQGPVRDSAILGLSQDSAVLRVCSDRLETSKQLHSTRT
jgi:hypothetical protein